MYSVSPALNRAAIRHCPPIVAAVLTPATRLCFWKALKKSIGRAEQSDFSLLVNRRRFPDAGTQSFLFSGTAARTDKPAPDARNRTELVATGLVMVYVGSSLVAFIALVGGLLALAVYPLIGVLITLAGMALLLYGVAGLCGGQERGKR